MPLSQDVQEARTIYIYNQNANDLYPKVYDEFSKWGQFTLVDEDETEVPDLIVTLLADPNGSDRILAVFSTKSQNLAFTANIGAKLTNGRTAKELVNRFKEKFPKKKQ